MVQCGIKRVLKPLILWFNVLAMGEIEWFEWDWITCRSFEKNFQTFYHFSILENCIANLNSRLFQECKILYKPCKRDKNSSHSFFFYFYISMVLKLPTSLAATLHFSLDMSSGSPWNSGTIKIVKYIICMYIQIVICWNYCVEITCI